MARIDTNIKPIKRGYGKVADRPAPTGAGAAVGDEFTDQDTGDVFKITATGAPGALVQTWALLIRGTEGTYVFGGSGGPLVAGVFVVPTGLYKLTATSKIVVTGQGATAFAVGRLDVTARTVGVPGIATFTVTSKNVASGATLVADLSSFDFVITDSDNS